MDNNIKHEDIMAGFAPFLKIMVEGTKGMIDLANKMKADPRLTDADRERIEKELVEKNLGNIDERLNEALGNLKTATNGKSNKAN